MGQDYNTLNWPVYKMIEFFRQFFSQQTKNDYQYNDNNEYTKIFIREKNAVKLESSDDRPIVALSRGPLNAQGAFVADLWGIDATSGVETYADLINTSITAHCISPRGLEAEEIASMVFGSIKFNRTFIMSYGFLRVTPPHVGEEQIISITGSDHELINVPVTFNIQYAISWTREDMNKYVLAGVEYRIRNVNDVIVAGS